MRTYFHVNTFTNNVSVRSQPEPPGWYIDSWPWTVPLGVEPHCQLPSLLVHWSYRERNTHAILYNYGDVHRQMHREPSLQWLHLQALCTYNVSENLTEDVRLNIYFRFKVLHTLQSNMSRIIRIALFIVSFHVRKLA